MASSWKLPIDLNRSGSQQFGLSFKDIFNQPLDMTGVSALMVFSYTSCDSEPIYQAGIVADGSQTGIVWTDIANGLAMVTIYGLNFKSVNCACGNTKIKYKIVFTKGGEAPLLVYGDLNLLPE